MIVHWSLVIYTQSVRKGNKKRGRQGVSGAEDITVAIKQRGDRGTGGYPHNRRSPRRTGASRPRQGQMGGPEGRDTSEQEKSSVGPMAMKAPATLTGPMGHEETRSRTQAANSV